MNISDELNRIASELRTAGDDLYYTVNGKHRMADISVWWPIKSGETDLNTLDREAKDVKDMLGQLKDKLEEAGYTASHIIGPRHFQDPRRGAFIRGAVTAYGEGVVVEQVWGICQDLGMKGLR